MIIVLQVPCSTILLHKVRTYTPAESVRCVLWGLPAYRLGNKS